tara:strand:- start:169 stop:333 length:165 start_codon:yes stop_codon:yes gene_type:complete
MSKENLKKFIKKYQNIEDNVMDDEDALWKQGADELMAALRIDIDYLKKYNELDQ